MSNDDLGQFPSPPTTSATPDITVPQPPVTTPPTYFEETPDDILSVAAPTPVEITPPVELPEEPPIREAPFTPTMPPAPPAIITPPIMADTPPQPVESTPIPATLPTPKGGTSFGSLIAIVLLLISGVALAVTVFLFSQSQQLKQQLSEVTQTLEQQRTTITPTPTPTIIDFPTPTPTLISTISAVIITPTPTTPFSATTLMPLADTPRALQVAINHMPNAQMIIIKAENVTSPTLATTKYFFRQDLTTKKYFYVLISNGNEPEIADKAIYVTPDNNIPSLNDMVQGNTLGIDLNEALGIANKSCLSNLCQDATVKAQYIKSGENVIWQLTFSPTDGINNPVIIQINATTKEILYKSAGF